MVGLQGMYLVAPVPEIWPFSPYPMYSGSVKKIRSFFDLKGVTADGHEFSFDIPRHLYPFNRTKLISGVVRIARGMRDPSKREQLDELFRYLQHQYAVTKRSGYHDGPPIIGLRLDIQVWDWSQTPVREVKPRTTRLYPLPKTKS